MPGRGGTGRADRSSCAVEKYPPDIITGRGGECGGLGEPGPSPHAVRPNIRSADTQMRRVNLKNVS